MYETVLKLLGKTREDIYTTYIQKCTMEIPISENIYKCEETMYKEADIIKPKIFITCGAHATRFVLKKYHSVSAPVSLEKIHGRGILCKRRRYGKDVFKHYVVPTYNLAVDNLLMKERIKEDVLTAMHIERMLALLF